MIAGGRKPMALLRIVIADRAGRLHPLVVLLPVLSDLTAHVRIGGFGLLSNGGWSHFYLRPHAKILGYVWHEHHFPKVLDLRNGDHHQYLSELVCGTIQL